MLNNKKNYFYPIKNICGCIHDITNIYNLIEKINLQIEQMHIKINKIEESIPIVFCESLTPNQANINDFHAIQKIKSLEELNI